MLEIFTIIPKRANVIPDPGFSSHCIFQEVVARSCNTDVETCFEKNFGTETEKILSVKGTVNLKSRLLRKDGYLTLTKPNKRLRVSSSRIDDIF